MWLSFPNQVSLLSSFWQSRLGRLRLKSSFTLPLKCDPVSLMEMVNCFGIHYLLGWFKTQSRVTTFHTLNKGRFAHHRATYPKRGSTAVPVSLVFFLQSCLKVLKDTRAE